MATWNLDDEANWRLFHRFTVPVLPPQGSSAKPWRNAIRACALEAWPSRPADSTKWAVRLVIRRPGGGHKADLDNFAKSVLDAFSGSVIRKDQYEFEALALYPDDDMTNVNMLQVAAEPANSFALEVSLYNQG